MIKIEERLKWVFKSQRLRFCLYLAMRQQVASWSEGGGHYAVALPVKYRLRHQDETDCHSVFGWSVCFYCILLEWRSHQPFRRNVKMRITSISCCWFGRIDRPMLAPTPVTTTKKSVELFTVVCVAATTFLHQQNRKYTVESQHQLNANPTLQLSSRVLSFDLMNVSIGYSLLEKGNHSRE